MFYEMIERKCNAWYAADDCPARGVIETIERIGKLRDAQVGAIRMYLFLKIAGRCRPLTSLFCDGFFNEKTIDFEHLRIAHVAYEKLQTSDAFRALYEYSTTEDARGRRVAPQLAEAMENGVPIDARAVFHQIFGSKNYPEYLFSLPMGAGKTYLMAAFIYLDLYYAMMEPENPVFAHNFIVLAPSGLKSSVVPSLRTIQDFDPHWILPEPAATQVKKLLHFEVLDAQSAQKRSNKTRNPNVQKIAHYADLPDSMGLVAVTNAEKVILDRVKEDGPLPMSLFEEDEDERDRQANELRNRIGRLPNLAIFIDEAHHAAADDIKLRQVVNQWVATGRGVTNVIGFSGTPYLQKKEKLVFADGLSIAYDDIPSIVYYYSLARGIGNFLKCPTVHKAAPGMESTEIVNQGVCEFLDTYGTKVYANGCTAKLAIFCANIAALEGLYSDVADIVAERGMDPAEVILKFHRGNKSYPMPEGAQTEFDSLDTDVSKKRIILLAGIGKEGWDCRSLTGVILSQKNACPTNKVLQTSCRCLRQVTKGEAETALIYLNSDNEKTLAAQLQKQQRMTIEEFQRSTQEPEATVHRYDRTQRLALPPIRYQQMRIEYTTEVAKTQKDIHRALRVHAIVTPDVHRVDEITKQDLEGHVLERNHIAYGSEQPRPANFALWVNEIAKESFGTLLRTRLLVYEKELRAIFEEITRLVPRFGGMRCYREDLQQSRVRVNVRRAFSEDWHDVTREECIPTEAQLLVVGDHFDEETVPQSALGKFYPKPSDVAKIIDQDENGVQVPENVKVAMEALKNTNPAMVASLRKQYGEVVGKDRSFHYLPYHTDSQIERDFLADILPESFMEERHLECYYNGDRRFTEFRIRCYEKIGRRGWDDIGLYTPDFLVLRRTGDVIDRVLIVETKGGLYANVPAFQRRRRFMETLFKQQNPNYDYLYMEDGLSVEARRQRTRQAVERFFPNTSKEAQ